MIILFIESDLIRHQILSGHPCPNCHTTDSLDLELRQRYARFGTLLVNPKGVFGFIQCLHCGYILPASRWTDQLHQAYRALKADHRTPRRYWKGAIHGGIGVVVGVMLICGVIAVMTSEARTQRVDFDNALKHPVSGLTLTGIMNNQSTYDIWRVDRVNDDTIWLKRYTGRRKLTNPYAETGWSSLPDSDFATQAIRYLRPMYADKCLIRIENSRIPNTPCEGVILTLLNN